MTGVIDNTIKATLLPKAIAITPTIKTVSYVTTLPVIDGTQIESVMIRGQITNNGQPNIGGIFNNGANAWFEYGTDPLLTFTSSTHFNQNSGISPAGYFNGFLQNILQPNTTYYYKACASGSSSSSSLSPQQFCGNILSFTTSSTSTPTQVSTFPDGCTSNSGYSTTTGQTCAGGANLISYWSGKVNQHISTVAGTQGSWITDLDGVSGANLDMLTYCKKWWPNTTSFVPFGNQTLTTWQDRGNVNNYTSVKMAYQCVQPVTPPTSSISVVEQPNTCTVTNSTSGTSSSTMTCIIPYSITNNGNSDVYIPQATTVIGTTLAVTFVGFGSVHGSVIYSSTLTGNAIVSQNGGGAINNGSDWKIPAGNIASFNGTYVLTDTNNSNSGFYRAYLAGVPYGTVSGNWNQMYLSGLGSSNPNVAGYVFLQ